MVKPLGVVVMEVKWEHSILVGRRISLLALLGHDDNKKWAIFQLVLLIVFKLYWQCTTLLLAVGIDGTVLLRPLPIQLKRQRPTVLYLGGGCNFNPKGISAMSGDTFGHYNSVGRCMSYWHLVGRGQRCCWIPYNAQNSPTAENYSAPKVNALRLRNTDIDRDARWSIISNQNLGNNLYSPK